MRLDERHQIQHAFAPLRHRLQALEKRLTPTGETLEFEPHLNLSPHDFDEIVGLAEAGFATVLTLDEAFGASSNERPRLYDDGMFWNDLFLVISAAGRSGRTGLLQVPESSLLSLVEVLVDVSHYSLGALGGELGILRQSLFDVIKCNHEALGNLLVGFPAPTLRTVARARGAQSPPVQEFVELTLAVVEGIEARGA